MSNDIPPPPWLEPDYAAELDRARLAYAAYFGRADVEAAFQSSGDRVLGGLKMPDDRWRLLPDQKDAYWDRTDASGLVATAFVNDRAGKIIIAYRGHDDARDAPAKTALNNDGDWWSQSGLPFAPRTGHTQRQAGQIKAALSGLAGYDPWDAQFADALTYAKHIRDKYEPLGYSIEVTGHDIGGAHAQVVAHTFGWPGRAFDAHGAQNIVESDGYRQWLAEHGLKRPAGIPGYDPGAPQEDNFLTYQTRFHEPSNTTGPHLGQTQTVSALAGRQGVKEYATYAVATAEAVVSEVPVVGEIGYGKALKAGTAGAEAARDVVKHQAAQGVDAQTRGGMERMVRVFETAARENKLPTFGQDGPEPLQNAPQRALGQNLPTPDRAVAALQSGLIQLGYAERTSQPLQVNGSFDDATRQAVAAFQARHDLPVSGVADAATQQALQQALLAHEQMAEQRQAENKVREQEKEQARVEALPPYRNPNHPKHALYAELKSSLEGMGYNLPEDRLHQIAGKMDLSGMRPGPQNRYAVRDDTFYVVSDIPGFRAHQRLDEPTPSIEQTMQHVHAGQLAQAEELRRLEQMPKMHGPSLGPGGPGGTPPVQG
jgi:hypothetical protein